MDDLVDSKNSKNSTYTISFKFGLKVTVYFHTHKNLVSELQK